VQSESKADHFRGTAIGMHFFCSMLASEPPQESTLIPSDGPCLPPLDVHIGSVRIDVLKVSHKKAAEKCEASEEGRVLTPEL